MSATKEIKQNLLVFHTAYNYKTILKFGLEIFITSRNASKVFDKVITINPVSDLQNYISDEGLDFRPRAFNLDETNLVIEGFSKRYAVLNNWPKLNFILAQFSLFRFILKGDFLRGVKIVRGEDPRFNGLYAFVLSRMLRTPLIIGVWGNPKRLRKLNQVPIMPRVFPSIRLEELVERIILRRADAVLAQNQENLNYALEARVNPEKTHLTQLGLGIDSTHFLPKELRKNVREDFEAWGAIGTKNLICISRLEALKMVDHAIKATKTLKDAGLDFKLILVGDGREIENLRMLAINEGLAGEIIFAGNRSQDWIAGALNFIDINVAPLCGRSLLEASLGGLPAVSYDVDWHNEIVFSGTTGFLVANLDFRAMGTAILELCKNDNLRKQMATTMLEKALELACPEKIAQRQKNIYQNLIFGSKKL